MEKGPVLPRGNGATGLPAKMGDAQHGSEGEFLPLISGAAQADSLFASRSEVSSPVQSP